MVRHVLNYNIKKYLSSFLIVLIFMQMDCASRVVQTKAYDFGSYSYCDYKEGYWYNSLEELHQEKICLSRSEIKSLDAKQVQKKILSMRKHTLTCFRIVESYYEGGNACYAVYTTKYWEGDI